MPVSDVRQLSVGKQSMKRIAIYLITMLVTFTTGLIVNVINPRDMQVSPEMREAEEYAVYSALIGTFHCDDAKVILIQSRTDSFYFYDGNTDETQFIKDHFPPATSEQTLNNFKSVDRQTKALSRRFALNNTYLLISEEERHQSFLTMKAIQEFHQKYPHSTRITLFSRVGFNKSFDEALVYSWGYCGGDCGGGGYYLFRRENGFWKLKQEKTWIS